MPPTKPRRDLSELARLGIDLFEQQVRPALRPADDGKFVAIDVLTGDYELDDDDYTAVMRLRSRRPEAEMWLEQAGFPAAYQMRVGR